MKALSQCAPLDMAKRILAAHARGEPCPLLDLDPLDIQPMIRHLCEALVSAELQVDLALTAEHDALELIENDYEHGRTAAARAIWRAIDRRRVARMKLIDEGILSP